MNKLKLCIGLTAFFLVVTSCEELEIVTFTPPIDLLTGGNTKTWYVIDSSIDGYSDLSDCDRDNEYIFEKAENKSIYQSGMEKCNEGDMDYESTFMLEGGRLTLDGFEYTVVKLTNSELVIRLMLYGSTIERRFEAK